MNKFAALNNNLVKLSNGQEVDRVTLEKEIKRICHYVQNVVIALKDEKQVVALIFPNKRLFSNPDYEKSPEEGCFCPRNLKEIGKCLSGCMHTLNLTVKPGFSKIHSAIIINSELSIEEGTLTPAFDVIDEQVIIKYNEHLNNLFGDKLLVKEEVFNIKFNT